MVSPRHVTKAKAEKCNGYHYLFLGEFEASEDRASSCKCQMLTPYTNWTIYKQRKLVIHKEVGMIALCSQRPEEDIGSPGGVVTGASEAPSTGNEN